MNNKIILNKIEFVSYQSKSWGWKLCDSYYHSFVDAIQEKELPDDPLEFLQFVLDDLEENYDEEAEQIFLDMIEDEESITINGIYFPYEETKQMLQVWRTNRVIN